MLDAGDLDALVGRLTADLRPVRRARPPVVSALGWLAVVLALGAALAVFADLGAVVRRLASAADLSLAAAGSTLTAILAAIAAFETGLPDRKPAWALLPVPAVLLWVGASGFGCLRSWLVAGTHAANVTEARWCLVFILGISVPLSALLVAMLRRLYPLRPGLTAILAGIASAGAAATLLNLFHPYDVAATDLVVHAVAVSVVVLVNWGLSGRVLHGAG